MTDDRPLTLLACQPLIPSTPTLETRDAHVAQLVAWLDAELAENPADLVLLPELSTIDYCHASFAMLDVLAETSDGPSFRAFSALAKRRRTMVSYGFPRRAANGFHISQAVIGPDGERVVVYDKMHLAQYGASMEKNYFRRGERSTVFEVEGVRVGVIICYDIRIPELCRSLVLQHGVHLIFHSGVYFRDESFSSWPAFAVTRAMENQVFLLSLNRAGTDYGASMFCRPWVGDMNEIFLFPEHDEACRHLTVDLAYLSEVRRNYTLLADRLETYG